MANIKYMRYIRNFINKRKIIKENLFKSKELLDNVNGYLLDINKDNPAQGYYYIFLIALISSAVGAICAIILYKLTKLKKSKENNN